MMIFSFVAMTGLEKCCITYAYLQWLCHSGERPVARGPLVYEVKQRRSRLVPGWVTAMLDFIEDPVSRYIGGSYGWKTVSLVCCIGSALGFA